MNAAPLIAVIDVNRDLTIKIQNACREMGLEWRIRCYPSIESAFTLLTSENETNPGPALILVNTALPDMAAFDFLYCAKKHPALKQRPIILLADRTSDEKSDICYQFNGNAYCHTPGSPQEVRFFISSINHLWLSPQQPVIQEHRVDESRVVDTSLDRMRSR